MRVRAGAVWLLATPLFYGVAHGVAWWAFDIRLEARAVALDLGMHWLLAAGLLALSRRAGGFLALQALVTGLLCLGNGAKMAFLGGPVVPDDLLALRNLFELLDGGRWFAATLLLVAPPAIFLFNLRLGRRGYPALAAFGALALVLAFRPAWVLEPLDRHLGYVVWDAQGNYRSRGPVAHLLQETARHLADREPAPGNRKVLTAALALLGEGPVPRVARVARQPQGHRNVHLVVLESFWDPSPLTAARFSRDPLDEGFRALWERAGRSQALSPVFGGYTANAEFEALCGFPVVHDGVKFERRLSADAPCLPRVFADRGYAVVASHPNVPAFWNRTHAYRRVGFERYWSVRDFAADDLNGPYLSDASLYRQVLEKIGPFLDEGRPLFNYVLTFSGHWDYGLGPSRPRVIAAASAVPEVEAYANNVYYKSREFMAFLGELGRRDPDALVVAFGDHLPFLGWSLEGYQESGLLAGSPAEFTAAMYGWYVSTPLLVIDGRSGPLPVGSMPLYELPRLILERTGCELPEIFDYTCPPPGLRVRPLPGATLVRLVHGAEELCRGAGEGPCDRAARWLTQVLTVKQDLFTGHQHALAPLRPAVLAGTGADVEGDGAGDGG